MNFSSGAAGIWLKYCRYGVKHYPINHIYRVIEDNLKKKQQQQTMFMT